MGGRDLAALQRLAGNRAVTGLVARQRGPVVQRQPKKAVVHETALEDIQINPPPPPEPFALQYSSDSLDKAAKDLAKDLKVEGDAIIVGIQQKLLIVYDKQGNRLTRQLELKLPKGLRPAPGVYMAPSAADAAEHKVVFPVRQLMVDPKTKDWVLGGYVAYLKEADEKKAPKPAGSAPGPQAPAASKDKPPSPGGGTAKGADAPKADDPAKPQPLPMVDLWSHVTNRGELDAVIDQHRSAIQFYLVPEPKRGAGGKPGGGTTTGFAGEVEGKGPPPNAPPWPVTMDGPRLQPADSEGTFSSRINWAANNNNAFSDQVISAVGNYIHYRWEVFDITEFARRNEAKIAAQAAQTKAVLKAADEKGIALDTAAGSAGTTPATTAPTSSGGAAASGSPATAPAAPKPSASADAANANAAVTPPVAGGAEVEEQSYEDVIAEKTRSKRGSGVDPTAETRNRKFKRSFEELWDDTARAGKDLANPSGSTWAERQSNAQANMLAIELMPVSAVITALGATLRWFADLFGGPRDNQEIHFGREGVYLVRVITTPAVTTRKDGTPVIRPSSVASRVVEVVKMERMLKEALEDPKAKLAQAELDLVQAKKSGVQERIDAAQEARDLKALETEGDPREYLKKKIAVRERELERVRKKYEGVAVGPILDVEREIDVLKHRLEVFELQEGRRVKGSETVVPARRVTAALVSEVTGQTYPLMLSVGPMKGEGNRHRWKLIDATGENAEGFDGYGDTPSAAVRDAFRQFGGQAQYGRGKIGVRIPDAVQLEDKARREFTVDSLPIGWAIAKGRLDDLVMTLAALGLFVVSAGTASMAIGAAIAAARLINRMYNGTLRLDAAAVSDVLAVLGAVGAAAGSAAKLSVKAANVRFEKVGSKLVMLEEGAAVSGAELANAAKALETASDVLKGIEAANEVLNYAGVIWGNVTFFNDMLEIAELESKGPENGGITHAEARRRRAQGLAGAINNNGMFVAPNVIKARQARQAAGKSGVPSESKGPTEGATTATGEAAPTPKPDTTPAPGEPQPRPEGPSGAGGEPGTAKRPAADEGPAPKREGETGRPADAAEPGTARGTAGTGAAARRPAADRPATGGTQPAPAEGGAPRAGAKPAEPAAPKPGSAQERAAVHKALQEAARGTGGDLAKAAENAIGKGGSWKEGLKQAVSKLEGEHRVAAEKALVEARDSIVNQEWAKIQERYPHLTLENPGTKSFSSDVDATVRPKDEARATGPEMARQVEDAARASQELADALRNRVGGETDIVIDTNIYSFIGEGRVKPTDPAARGAQQHVDVVVGLAEQMRGQTDAQFQAFEKRLLEGAKDPRVNDEARRVLGQAKEFHDARQGEWNRALAAEGVKPGQKPTPEQAGRAREKILAAKKSELSGLLGAATPSYDAVARKQSEINWFAPDAYATPSAFKQAVAHGQRLKGTATPAAEWTGGQVAGKLREAAAKLPPEHPQAKQYLREAGRVESQQRLLEMTVKELTQIQDSPPVDIARVKDLEARAKAQRDAIAHAAEQLVVAQILGETMPAGRSSAERLSEAAAASGANMGMLESHVAHAKDVDGKVKAAAKYAGRIGMAEFLGGLRPGMDPIARLIGDFVKSRWGFLENASPQIMRDMFVRYARLTGRHTDLVYNARGEAVGASDALKQRFVNDVIEWARATNREIQQSAIGMKAFDNPTPTEAPPGGSEPAPRPGRGPEGPPRPPGGEPGAEPGAPAKPPTGGPREQPGRRTGGPEETPAGPAEQPAPREPIKITKAGGVTKPSETPTLNPPGLNQPFDFRIDNLRDAERAIRGIANGDAAPLSDRGVQLPPDYKTQGREWGLARMPDGTFAIVQGDVGGVAWGGLPHGTIPLAHTHPITPDRALSRPATIRELIHNYETNGVDAKLEQDAVHVFQSPEDVLLVAANQISNHDVHTGYVHTGDGVLKTPTGAKGELQVSFNIYDAQHIGDVGDSPVVEAAFTAHDEAGNVLYLGRVTVINFEPNRVNPRTMMFFGPYPPKDRAKLSPPNPDNLLPMHATPMAGGGAGRGRGAGSTGGGTTGGTEGAGPATRRERPGSTDRQETVREAAKPAKGAPGTAKPGGVPGGFTVTDDGYSTTVKSRANPNALARIEPEGGGVFKMTDVQKRDQPSGTGAALLAEALKAVKAQPGNTLIIHNIVNRETVATHDAGGDPATSLLGRMSQRALEQIGLAPRSMTWEIIRGKLCIVIQIQ